MKTYPLSVAVAILLIVPLTFAPPRKAEPPKSLRLYVFDCGFLDIADTSAFQLKKDELASVKMSVPCFLIVHPKGTLMWDLGAIPDNSFRPGGGHAPLRNGNTTKRLTDQLAGIGYAPADITYISFSHFHWDHIGNANLFAPTATWLVRKLEREIMFTEPPPRQAEPAHYSALKNSKTVIVTKPDHDVFGDRRVILKSAPGHSPDHQVLLLKLAKTGPVVLSGDLYHYPEERMLNKVPTTEFNAAQTVASRASLELFLKKTHAQLWIEHDFVANAALRKAPEFYQ